ncbi:hypothetical protein CSKR_113608 [Clonorchis sinensis]|uniref:Uncharacterized protein n=1 Tax=Clonorchis sinensis TaxID=79923 RepID=A0A419Q2E9_CLOSI|nr:hypothetical protein CSKR_113608 [Clonorchis sinensis]
MKLLNHPVSTQTQVRLFPFGFPGMVEPCGTMCHRWFLMQDRLRTNLLDPTEHAAAVVKVIDVVAEFLCFKKPSRCLTAMPPEGGTRDGILPGCPNPDRRSREEEIPLYGPQSGAATAQKPTSRKIGKEFGTLAGPVSSPDLVSRKSGPNSQS